MTKKRLRYSELGVPAAEKPTTKAADKPPETPIERAPEPSVPVAAVVAPAPDPQPADVVTARPRRNSTPVELARALAAEQAAEHEKETPAVRAPRRSSGARQIPRTLRDQARARTGTAELLMFRIAGERFAVELLAVEEVIDLPVIHHVPEMPPAMLGVVTVRGSLTPVYSPHHALGLPLALREALLIFRRTGSRIGVLIDDVEDAISLDLSELRDAPGGDDMDNVVLGVIRHADALVGIVDADALIAACQTAALLETA
jgi:purine-binding chemotaxis protein CheW